MKKTETIIVEIDHDELQSLILKAVMDNYSASDQEKYKFTINCEIGVRYQGMQEFAQGAALEVSIVGEESELRPKSYLSDAPNL